MKIHVEIHTYPSNGDDAARKHLALGMDDVCAALDARAAGVALERAILKLLDEDRNSK